MMKAKKKLWSHWYWLLVAQFPLALCVPFYNTLEPSWGGVPFFYWFQLAAIFVAAGLTAIVYFATTPRK
jgi:hypothetical protein